MLFRLLPAILLAIGALAQDSPAPVIFEGREVFRIHAGFGAYSAADRAREVAARLQSIADRKEAAPATSSYMAAQNATAVTAGGALVVLITESDAKAARKTQAELATEYANAATEALGAYRQHRSLATYAISSAIAASLWATFFAIVWLLRKALQWVRGRVESWVARKTTSREARGLGRLIWERYAMILFMGVRAIVGLFLLFQFSFLISYTFSLFPATAGISTTLLDYLKSTFGGIGKSVLNYLPSGGFVVIVCILTYYVLRFLAFLTRAVEQGDLAVTWMLPDMARPTYQLVRIFVVIFALVVAFPYLPGSQSDAFKGVSILIGLIISVGSGSSISNVLAGIMLTYMRPFRTGDRVKIADTLGDVLGKNLLVTRLRTIKNVEVVIPNSSILSSQILNYSAMARNHGLVLHTSVTIGYSTPWHQVHSLLISAAQRTEAILTDPAPYILQTSLNDYHITYELNAFTNRPNVFEFTYSELHQNIQDTFAEAGVEIMSPAFFALRKGPVQLPPESSDPIAGNT